MMIRTDPGEIQRALINLAVNARDAMPDGGTLTISTALAALPGENDTVPYVRLVVADTGMGMPESVQSRIFEPFFTTKPPGKGTGLGLSTVYGIVQQSRGMIQVESSPGAGTRFIIYLPCAGADGEPLTEQASAGLVLLTEDDDMVRQLVRLSLEQGGYTVLEALNGGSAMELLLSYRDEIKLLITDVMMPDMLGTDLARHTRATLPSLPILLISGYTGAEQSTLEFELLPKPFSVAALLKRIQQLLGREE
jgi:CheY-like chemotaxis protein